MKRSKKNFFYYLNQKNIIVELQQYGQVLSFKDLFFSYLKFVIISIAAAYLFKLPSYGYMIIIVTSLLFVPSQLLSFYKSLHEQRKFSDISLYIEKMLYFYGKSKNIFSSLQDLIVTFPTGNIHYAIEEAIEIIKTDSCSNVEKKALKFIEDEFPNTRVRTLHNFMLRVKEGGNPDLGVNMLLDDRNLWTSRIISDQQDNNSLKKNIVIATVLTLGFCLITLYLPLMVKAMERIDISKNIIVQWTAIGLIIFLFYFYTKTNKKLSSNWVEYDLLKDEKNIEKSYVDFINIDMQKEKTKSYIYAAIVSVITVIFFLFFNNKMILFIGGFTVLFFINTYKIGYKIEKKNITREISKSIPIWLLSIALLKQGKKDNIITAIVNSYENAPPILRPAVNNMLIELESDPSSPIPFNNFLSSFALSEVREAMSTLYGINEGLGGDIEKEFKEIITKANKYMDKEEEAKNRDRQALMSSYIFVPAFLGSIKLMIDMMIMLMCFVSSSGNLIK